MNEENNNKLVDGAENHPEALQEYEVYCIVCQMRNDTNIRYIIRGEGYTQAEGYITPHNHIN